jgi:HlyD family secretion protein
MASFNSKKLNWGALSMKKKFLRVLSIIIIVFVVGGGGYYAYKKYASKSTATSAAKYSIEKVTKTNLEVTVEATGTVSGIDAVNVYSSNSGLLSGMTAKAGDYVNKGDLFCKIEDTTTQQEIENAKISLQHSKLELQALESQMDSLNVKAPMDGNITKVFVVSGDDTASMKSAYGGMAVMTTGSDNALEVTIPFPSSGGKVAEVYASAGQNVKKGDTLFKLDDTSIKNSIQQKENEIQQAVNSLKNKEEDLAKSTITTPISGIVTVLNVKNGEQVSSGDLKLIATITDTSKMEVTLPVDELDINKVKVGQKATIKIDDIEDKSFEGTVQSISQNGTTSNNVTTYSVVVSIDNPENVKIGMNANVTVKIQSKENVLAVPVEAILTKNSKKYVMVSSGVQQPSTSNKQAANNVGTTKLVEVQTGIKTTSMIEITSGVSENETILIQLKTSSSSSNSMPGGMPGGMGGGMGGPPQ